MFRMDLTQLEIIGIWTVIVVAIISLIYAELLRRNVMAEDTGTPIMQKIWNGIKTGLVRQRLDIPHHTRGPRDVRG